MCHFQIVLSSTPAGIAASLLIQLTNQFNNLYSQFSHCSSQLLDALVKCTQTLTAVALLVTVHAWKIRYYSPRVRMRKAGNWRWMVFEE